MTEKNKLKEALLRIEKHSEEMQKQRGLCKELIHDMNCAELLQSDIDTISQAARKYEKLVPLFEQAKAELKNALMHDNKEHFEKKIRCALYQLDQIAAIMAEGGGE